MSKERLEFLLLNSVSFSTGSAYSGSKFEIKLFLLLELSPSSSLSAKNVINRNSSEDLTSDKALISIFLKGSLIWLR